MTTQTTRETELRIRLAEILGFIGVVNWTLKENKTLDDLRENALGRFKTLDDELASMGCVRFWMEKDP